MLHYSVLYGLKTEMLNSAGATSVTGFGLNKICKQHGNVNSMILDEKILHVLFQKSQNYLIKTTISYFSSFLKFTKKLLPT